MQRGGRPQLHPRAWHANGISLHSKARPHCEQGKPRYQLDSTGPSTLPAEHCGAGQRALRYSCEYVRLGGSAARNSLAAQPSASSAWPARCPRLRARSRRLRCPRGQQRSEQSLAGSRVPAP
jgi:hypothetical protein